ncbi:GCN5-related N-acetyltransferase [Sporolactobacillus inulinus]|jgi:ribosomal protein S18 acetylase RimI-like enzyme|uniref:GCN5-related N-acetyltransferase n=1 Tax=Sporolactobacillus inulinus TaxID=2078 RepID=A0A4Y1ZBY6_9BACL|nr:GNAT family N-acetyltransferase [Sporolactobacillus inulinus]GAY76606.1 GCN5-related N-acetyltransferase [Sporolactobacillus inulinus]
MIKFIKATVKHADDLGLVHASSWKAAYQGIVPQSYLDQLTAQSRAAFFKKAVPMSKHAFYIAYSDGKPVGMISFGKARDQELAENVGEISALYYRSNVWGKGYGRQLMDLAIRQLKEQNYKTVSLWVFEQNAHARRFYEKYGFVFDGKKEELEIGGKKLTEMRYHYQIPD